MTSEGTVGVPACSASRNFFLEPIYDAPIIAPGVLIGSGLPPVHVSQNRHIFKVVLGNRSREGLHIEPGC
jgi:hypothetical protein